MTKISVVILPPDAEPSFDPDYCVRCAAEAPSGRIWATDRRNTFGAITYVIPLLWFVVPKVRVAAPACARCAWFHRFRRVGLVLLWLVIIYSVLFLLPASALGVVGSSYFGPLLIGLALLYALSWLKQKTIPPSFDVALLRDKTAYLFSNPFRAAKFFVDNEYQVFGASDAVQILVGLRPPPDEHWRRLCAMFATEYETTAHANDER